MLRLTVAVPKGWPQDRYTAQEVARLGSCIVVPRLDDLAPGAFGLATLEVGLEAPDNSVDLTMPGFFPVDIPLPALAPQGSKTYALIGRFIDMQGNPSDLASMEIVVTDIRPPRTYPTGIGLFWSSAPGPSPTVEVKLSWQAAAKSRHRVYLTDQAGLELGSKLAALSPDGSPRAGLSPRSAARRS